MPLHNCPECGFEIPEGELVCFNCGFLIDEPIVPNPGTVYEGELPLDGEALHDAQDMQHDMQDMQEDTQDAPDTSDIPMHEMPDMSEASDMEESMHYEGPSDESLQRGCLISVGLVGTLILVIMMIVTFNIGTS